jgi:RNA polymerase sigma-70 factor, ECF subfamily
MQGQTADFFAGSAVVPTAGPTSPSKTSGRRTSEDRKIRRFVEDGDGCCPRRESEGVSRSAPRSKMAWTDEELVARSIGGDVDSFNQLVIRWERPIYALAYRVIGREEDARDVCQEAFLRAFRALPGFKGEAKFSSWLYRITLNLCRDWMRREKRAPLTQVPEGMDLSDLAGAGEPGESIEEQVSRRDMSRVVARVMATLPEEQRTAIVLKEYHGLTFQEIADLLGCPLSTVKTRLYQGLTVLRRQLRAEGVLETARPAADRRRGAVLNEATGQIS